MPCTLLRIILCLLLAASLPARAQSADVLGILIRLRAPGGACAANAQPLWPQPALDRAATRLAGGASLEAALKSAGYRMTEAQVIALSGDVNHERLGGMLAGRYCKQIAAARLGELGVYERGGQLWIVLAAPFAPGAGLAHDQVASRMLALLNQARAVPRNCGGQFFAAAAPLNWSPVLEGVAAAHAEDMAANNYFSHEGRDGTAPDQRVRRAGYNYRMTGENIAAGQSSPEEAMAGWIKSPGHCANLMTVGFAEVGVAFALNPASQMGIYWVQVFGTRQ